MISITNVHREVVKWEIKKKHIPIAYTRTTSETEDTLQTHFMYIILKSDYIDAYIYMRVNIITVYNTEK